MFTAIDNATKKEILPFKNGTAMCKFGIKKNLCVNAIL